MPPVPDPALDPRTPPWAIAFMESFTLRLDDIDQKSQTSASRRRTVPAMATRQDTRLREIQDQLSRLETTHSQASRQAVLPYCAGSCTRRGSVPTGTFS